MEKLNFVNNGVLRLPPGFRFHPTDLELVLHYLRRKVLSRPLPASVVSEVDVCKADPWDLPGEKGKERYFFSTREAKYPNGNRSNRATVSGYWKATGKDKPVVAGNGGGLMVTTLSNTNHRQVVVGMKKTLVFYRGKPPHGSRTDWIMHEYRLDDLSSPRRSVSSGDSPLKKNSHQSPSGDWVLCRIFLKKRKSKSNEEEECNDEDYSCNTLNATTADNNNNNAVTRIDSRAEPVYYDFMSRDRASTIEKITATDLNLAPSSSSSGSSGVTDLSDLNESSDREEGSSCDSFFPFQRKP